MPVKLDIGLCLVNSRELSGAWVFVGGCDQRAVGEHGEGGRGHRPTRAPVNPRQLGGNPSLARLPRSPAHLSTHIHIIGKPIGLIVSAGPPCGEERSDERRACSLLASRRTIKPIHPGYNSALWTPASLLTLSTLLRLLEHSHFPKTLCCEKLMMLSTRALSSQRGGPRPNWITQASAPHHPGNLTN